jgi:NAD(P)-dependent dehydrogenase (short-subunit alcohol dehydrogenase family)
LKTVRVVGVAPSAIDTDFQIRHSTPERLRKVLDQVPLGRIGTVQEVVDVIAFLASGHAAYVSGSVVKILAGR